MKKVLIPFSGGLDSTYLIWKNLKEGNKVTTVYFEIENNSSKVELEKIHRSKIINLFIKEFGQCSLESSIFQYKILVSGVVNDYTLIQAPIWMLGAFMGSDNQFDEVQMGYVANDDTLSYLKEIQTLFNSYQPFSTKPLPQLTFPIIKKKKEEMLRELPEEYSKYVYSCENPLITKNNDKEIEYHYCGECVPCQRYKRELEYKKYSFSFLSGCTRKVIKSTGEFSFQAGINSHFMPKDLGESFNLENLSLEELYYKLEDNPSVEEESIKVPTRLLNIILNKDYKPTEEEQKEINELDCFAYSGKLSKKSINKQLSLFTDEEMNDFIKEQDEVLEGDFEYNVCKN